MQTSAVSANLPSPWLHHLKPDSNQAHRSLILIGVHLNIHLSVPSQIPEFSGFRCRIQPQRASQFAKSPETLLEFDK